MKIITILILVLGSFNAFGKTNISCQDSVLRHVSLGTSMDDYTPLGGELLQIRYNYAAAEIICPYTFRGSVEIGEAFNCAGIWSFDHREPTKVNGTPVVAKFIKKGEQWKVSFITSYGYGRKKVNLDCEISTEK